MGKRNLKRATSADELPGLARAGVQSALDELATTYWRSATQRAEALKVDVSGVAAPDSVASFDHAIDQLVAAVNAKRGRLAKVKKGRRADLVTAAGQLNQIKVAVAALGNHIAGRPELA